LWLLPLAALAALSVPFLWQQWTASVWVNSHGMMVPFLAAYLAVHALRASPVRDESPSALGFLVLLPALALIVADGVMRTDLLAVIGLLLALPGISLLVLGPKRTRALLLPWLISLLMLPIPEGLLGPVQIALRKITAAGTEQLLHLFDFPLYREGFALVLPRNALYVSDECSGFSTLYATATISLILAYLSPSTPRRILILALAVPLALACNVVRVAILALLVDRFGADILDTAMHPASGWLTFTVAALILFFIAEWRGRRAPS
jgi:exosortase